MIEYFVAVILVVVFTGLENLPAKLLLFLGKVVFFYLALNLMRTTPMLFLMLL